MNSDIYIVMYKMAVDKDTINSYGIYIMNFKNLT